MIRIRKKRVISFLLGVCVVIMALLFNFNFVKAAPVEQGDNRAEVEAIKPTLNAAVSDKALTVNAVSENGIKAIYINGYEFRNTGNGNLKIKLQQFDAGYNKFYIYAEDNAGLVSDLYEVDNPYYDEDKTDDKDPSKELPVDASPTDPTEAVGTVSEHLFNGGREFYQIETANGKVFYLIVDMLSDEEKVYFLTEISERDLLNATSDASETLPRNSAIPEDGIPDGAIINNNASPSTIETVFGKKEADVTEEFTDTGDKGTGAKKENIQTEKGESMDTVVASAPALSSTTIIYILMGVVAVVVIVVVSASKKKKRNKKKDTLDIPDETTDEEEE